MRRMPSHAVNGIDSEASMPTADCRLSQLCTEYHQRKRCTANLFDFTHSFSPSHRLLGRPRTGCVSHFRLQRETSLFFFPNAFTHTAPFNGRSQHS